jgi:lipopolysaccharide/colanic/teichoic acid biosynthesis glycosyltransferase
MKRTLDIVGAGLALALTGPALAATILGAYLAGVRPILVKHSIYGAGGKKEDLWLLSREISTSLLLRGVPTLLQVITGRVSLVGPRPIPWNPDEHMPPALWLISAKPGLTGPWRLSGPNASLADQAVQDLTYVRTYNVWEDVRLLCESLRRMPRTRQDGELGRWQGRPGSPAPATYHGPRLIEPSALQR